MRRVRTTSAVVGAAVAALVLPMGGPAAAATVSEPIIEGLAGPLQLAVGSDGTVYVSQAFSGTLTAIDKKKGAKDLASVPTSEEFPAEIAGVDAAGKGTVTFTTSGMTEDGDFFAEVRRVQPNGKVRSLADLAAYEEINNPDAGNSYGFQNLTPECAAQVPEFIGGEPYNGIIESHPYSVALLADGSRVVGDAAGNTLLRVADNGSVSTLAVLPPQPLVVTEEATAIGIPECAIGSTYNFEAVPTDVELGPDGLLYVSLLPGGPEEPVLGARGSVVTVDPATGAVEFVAGGFFAATNVAVAPDGTVYVAELFGNKISRVSGSGGVPIVEVPNPAAVEWANGKLYATVDVFGNGSVVTITP